MKKMFSILALLLALCVSGCNNANESMTDKKTQANTEIDTVVVPNVIGTNVDEAAKKLEELGLVVEIKKIPLYAVSRQESSLGINEIWSQSIAAGVVCSQKTNITITYVIDFEFEYVLNTDGTITLTNLITWYSPEKTLTIPIEYDGYQVSAIKDSAIPKTLTDLFEGWTVKVPKEIDVQQIVDYKIIRF